MLDVSFFGLESSTEKAILFFEQYNLNVKIPTDIFSLILSKGLFYTIVICLRMVINIYRYEKEHFIIVLIIFGISMLMEMFFDFPIYKVGFFII